MTSGYGIPTASTVRDAVEHRPCLGAGQNVSIPGAAAGILAARPGESRAPTHGLPPWGGSGSATQPSATMPSNDMPSRGLPA